MLYGRLDDLREQASARLARVLRESGGTHQARAEREAASVLYTERLGQVNAAENGLCFGRLDFTDGGRRYIGRLGLLDESADFQPLLIDWRAPAARPFYLATAAAPDGVRRRRHIRTVHRTVVNLDDEILDLATAGRSSERPLTGEAALLAAVNAGRTGRMSDIVETIQAEQDRIIRSDHAGVLVVQGGPGTGKTAVALHRAAFLLYTYRRELSRRGVLIVGPNATFLRYISQVLPSLGESGVLLSTLGELYPGITARRVESPEAAEIKGRLAMADVVAAAVRDRQRVPDDVLEIAIERDVLRLDRSTCVAARELARQSRKPHNLARSVFVREVVDALARQVADRIGADVRGGANLLDEADVEEIRRELHEDTAVRRVLAQLWPPLTPQQLLADLFSSAERLARAAPELTAAQRQLLLREPHRPPADAAQRSPRSSGRNREAQQPPADAAQRSPRSSDRNEDAQDGWTPADVPLLDEAAELLGEDRWAAAALAERARTARVAAAQGVLDIVAGSAAHELDDLDIWGDHEFLTVNDLVDATRLAERHEDQVSATVAERAAADRGWAFGHVIVDEAQELSEMAWRTLMRRCPSRSMTIVGDVAQTGDPAGTSSWRRVLEPCVGDRWRLERLTVNYRTPAEIMAVAAGVLAEIDPPYSVRETGVQPWGCAVDTAGLADRVAAIAAHEAAETGDGRLAVLVPVTRLAEVGRAVADAVPGAAIGASADLENPVVVLSVKQAKGLEFDSVLVVEPERILAESSRGRNDLYVALTRATQRLGVVHTGELPEALAALSPRQDALAGKYRQ